MQHYNAKRMAQKSQSLKLEPSYLLVFIYVLLGVATSACVMFLPIGLIYISILSAFIFFVVLYVVLCHALLRFSWSLTQLRLNSKNQWLTKNRLGKEAQVLIEASTFVSPNLTIINLRDAQKLKRYYMVIIPQRVDAEAYRKLRVLLRWDNVYKAVSVEASENSSL